MSDLKSLIQKRGVIKGRITRLQTYIETENHELKGSYPLKLRVTKLEECWVEFKTVQDQIELLDSNEEDERALFEEMYFLLNAKAEKIINYLDRQVSSPQTDSSESIAPMTKVKLPVIPLPTFSGGYDNWLGFKESFTALIDNNPNLSDIQRFHYLRASLKGEAFQVIQSLELSAANYSVAWNLLQTRFHNKKIIVSKHISGLFQIPKLEKECAIGLRVLLDESFKHLRALEALELPVDSWDAIVVHLLTNKLDDTTLRDWELECTAEVPSMEQFATFIGSRCQMLDALNKGKNTFSHNKVKQISGNSQANKFNYSSKSPYLQRQFQSSSCLTAQKIQCYFCKANHVIYNCDKFLKLSVSDRIKKCKQLNLCPNCLRINNHDLNHCPRGGCRICGRAHNSLLHLDFKKNSSNNMLENQINPDVNYTNEARNTSSDAHQSTRDLPELSERTSTTLSCASRIDRNQQIVLSTVLVHVTDSRGDLIPCRALLDSGAQTNFITERFAQRLGIKRNTTDSAVTGINGSYTKIRHYIECQISSRLSSFSTQLQFYVLSKITENLPSMSIPMQEINFPNNICLADPTFYKSERIDMLIGAELFLHLLLQERIELDNGLLLQHTKLGWIVSGGLTLQSKQNIALTVCHSSEPLDKQLQKFWILEELPIKPKITIEELRCEEHYSETVRRDPKGRYILQLPLNDNINHLGESRLSATNRLEQLERRFAKDPKLKQDYTEFIQEYLTLGHMEQVPESEITSQSMKFYLPHHAVIKESSSTTKLRVVFDGSAKSSTGVSLNDTLMVGPTIQSDLWSIVLRFRTHRIVIAADVAKMYRQIRIDSPHTNLQLILWRNNPQDTIQTFRLLTVTYGTCSAPFQATRTLVQLSKDEGENYPLAAHVTTNDFYMDDLMSGTDTIEEAFELQSQLNDMFIKGGFELRKWCSNDQQFLNAIQKDNVNNHFEVDNNQMVKTLGLYWNPQGDYFYFVVNFKGASSITKRSILSDLAHIFDPLGLIGPAIARAKIFMQQLWLINLNWDDTLPDDLARRWLEFRKECILLEQLKVPRLALANRFEISIHGYSDASEKCYGACLYLRCVDPNGTVSTTLLTSKSRVAPIKQVTLPRLELCGTLILARLIDKTISALKMNSLQVYLWCDSTVVLSWLKGPASHWKTFVAHRVQEIQNLTNNYSWNHVTSADNPADCLSRGWTIHQVINSNLWWHGPLWLTRPSQQWPIQEFTEEEDVPDKKVIKLTMTITIDDSLVYRYSSLNRLQRVTAYVKRFIYNCRNPTTKLTGDLSVAELEQSLNCWIQLVQSKIYAQELHDLKNKGSVSSKSKLCSLKPFLDEKLNIIRVGGRLRNSIVTPDQKYPIILPPHHKLTELMVTQEHIRSLHTGPQALLSHIRLKYWLINGRSLVRKVVHSCIKCFERDQR